MFRFEGGNKSQQTGQSLSVWKGYGIWYSIEICVVSKDLLKALNSPLISSKLVLQTLCSNAMFWAPGHSGMRWRRVGKTLANEGSEIHLSWCHKFLLPIGSIKFNISENTATYSSKCWTELHKQSNIFTMTSKTLNTSSIFQGGIFVQLFLCSLTGLFANTVYGYAY